MATALDKDKLHEVLDEAVIVIAAEAFERSQKDPRVQDLFKGGQALHAELNAKKANF
jgi:hypothetical protein